MNTTDSGLQYLDTTIGEGAEAKAGQQVTVHYTGWLYNDGTQGAKFDSSKDRGNPFAFSLGQRSTLDAKKRNMESYARRYIA